jgi:glycosyltransferase involved in cell wall biosynthesis
MIQPDISIILPVYNQAEHIGQVCQEYEVKLQGLPYNYEILLVVNGSSDDSIEVCQRLAAESSTIRCLHSVQGGWGLAVRLGIADARGRAICYTNSARTPAQTLQLHVVYALTNPGVVIKANRRIRESAPRRLGSLLYNLECRTLFDLAYWDINGTPKVFPAEFEPLRSLQRNDDLIDLEFNIICREQGYTILEIPVFSTRRHGGQSTTNIRSALRMYIGALKMWQQRKRASRPRD